MTNRRQLFLPLVAAAVVAAALAIPGHSIADRSPKNQQVVRSSYACATPKGVTVAAGRYATHAGAKTTATTIPSKESVPELASTTSWSSATPTGAALVVSSDDAKAAGAVGFTAETAKKSDGGGLAIASCAGVVQDAWYIGAGSGQKHFTTITLTNLSDSPAVTDVTMWGENGPVDAVDADGIVLKAFESKRIPITALAAGEPELAVHVVTSRGAVSVALRDTSTAVYAGTEMLPTTRAPARRQLLPGLASKTTTKTILLLNTSGTTRRTKVEVLGKSGAFVPNGLDAVKVPSGRLTAVTLPKSVGNDAAAMRLTSDGPVAAAVRMATDTKDFAYAVTADAFTGPAIVPMSIGVQRAPATLVLTAPGKSATTAVEAYDKNMKKVGSISVSTKMATTSTVDLSASATFGVVEKSIAYVMVRATEQIIGSTIYGSGTQLSAVPLSPVPLVALTPDVRPGR